MYRSLVTDYSYGSILHIVIVMRGPTDLIRLRFETRFILPFPDLNPSVVDDVELYDEKWSANPRKDVGKEVVPPDGNYVILVAY